MTRSRAIASHLPYLRRYARALTGSQKSGDNYVRATLEAMIAAPEIVPAEDSSRVALYRLFQTIWASTELPVAPNGEESTGIERSTQARLNMLVPEKRQALLLTTLEGFNVDEAGQILGRSGEDVGELIRLSMMDIGHDIQTDILIIEDEPVIALDLATIVKELGHRVVNVATTRDEAVGAAQRKHPGLILADIQLADDSSGIDAVKDIHGNGRTPVIFITAYPERLLTGEKPEPAFLIAKPFLPESVKTAISQALFFHTPEHTH